MRKSKPYRGLIGKIFLSVFFLLAFIRINAQAESSIDSATVYMDTLVHSDEQQGVNNAEQQENYFLKKNNSTDRKDSIQFRHLPANELKKMQDDETFWYANANIKKKVQEESRTSFGDLTWLRTVLWLIIIGGFTAFIMIYLSNSNISLFSRKNRSITEAIEERDETENIFAINYQREIDKAIKSSNYRLGVRLLFLQLLRKLSDKNIIKYKQDNTNFDYLLQLSPTNYYKDFFRITRNYEYSWYGQFDVSPEAFNIIQKDVENFENTLK